MALVLAMQPADNMPGTIEFPAFDESFPVFDESIASMAETQPPLTPTNKIVDRLVSSPASRNPSPQPTHLGLPYRNGNVNGHRILRSATVGYTAPEFKGKKEQMVLGE